MQTKDILLITIISILALYLIINLPLHWMWKFALGIAAMYAVGEYMIRKHKLSGEMGLVLFKSQHGLKLIDWFAKHERFWQFFAEMGMITAYGAFAFVLLPKRPSLKAVVCGFVLLTLMMSLVGPFVMPFLADTVGINIEEKPIKKTFASAESGFSILPILVVYGGGLFAVLFFSVILYGAVILVALQNAFFTGTQDMAKVTPGVAPLLPGVNLPLIEGIIALIVILVVHEGSHAILARIARVPILSSGIVLFGIIPIGAFVEPDEDKLRKTARAPQTAVLIAGPAANIVASLAFFVLFLGFIYLTHPSFEKGFPVATFTEGWMQFVYMVFGLCFTLNFAIGTVNLLPLPFLDGYRTLELNIKSKAVVDTLMALTAIAFLVNLLPWLFK